MRRSRRRAVAGRLGWALGLGILAAPSLAEAQLFPNRTIRRERTPCANEAPYYKSVRQNYFGYYPTCWSRFPAGWGCPCPNPELPNAAASFAVKPLQPIDPRDLQDPSLPQGDDGGVGPTVPGPSDDRPGVAAPALPSTRGGAFGGELTPREPITPPGVGAGAGGTNTPPVPDPTGPPQTSRSGGDAKPEVRPAATSLLEVPRINPPTAPATVAIEPPTIDAAPTLPADATLTGVDAAAASQPATPTLMPTSPPMPDASTPPAQAPESLPAPMPASVTRAMTLPPVGDDARTGAPAQAPQKKGILTGLFDRQGRRRR